MTGNPKCPLCQGKGTVTHWVKRGREYKPVPNHPCFCARKRCGLCNSVVTTTKEIGSALCNACAKSIADSTNLELEAQQ